MLKLVFLLLLLGIAVVGFYLIKRVKEELKWEIRGLEKGLTNHNLQMREIDALLSYKHGGNWREIVSKRAAGGGYNIGDARPRKHARKND